MTPTSEEFWVNFRWAMHVHRETRPILDSNLGNARVLAEAARLQLAQVAPPNFWEVFSTPAGVDVLERVLDRMRADSYPVKTSTSSRREAQELASALSRL